ncbi:RNA polymerase sigma factor [Microbacterium sp. 1.5R]|uniref:RNA polymerase sigma factor n=1 Tax=Microbacterium sp. 1.5R TaxID=1916917 RepID=UPI0011A91095|nr:RNA polymerase sigma factor [Microbacterium sp. 1.5R]
MRSAGPEAPLLEAVRASADDLLAYLERRVGREDAEDLLSETMVVAWRRLVDLPDDARRARMWLFGIARTTLLNHARGAARRRSLVDRLRGPAREAQSAPADDGLAVRDAIDRLDPDLGEIVRLVHWERFSLVEVAELLRLPASTVRGRYARARDSLVASLAEEPPGIVVARTRP